MTLELFNEQEVSLSTMTLELFNEQEVSLSTMTLELFNEEEASIATNINQQSILLTSNIGGKAIDRCSPHLRDPLRAKSVNPPLSKPPNSPKTFYVAHSKAKKKALEKKPTTAYSSPASSQRYLLSDSNSGEFVEKEIVPSIIVNEFSSKVEESNVVLRPLEELKLQNVKFEETNDIRASSSSSPPTTTSSHRSQEQQVVVLKVSLHCKGCEGKVRKHISKMEGVTSFKTDLANKKVTVIGDVTPLGVLNSISKVKNAQLWPSQPQAACY